MQKTFYILTQYLKLLDYSIHQDTLEQRLLSDPNNDIVALTNSLDFLSINSVVATVPKEALSQLPKYFIAQIGKNNQFSLALASQTADQKIKLLIDNKTSYLLEQKDFIHNWTGLIIAIEANENKTTKVIGNTLILQIIPLFGALMALFYIGFTSLSLLKTTYLLLGIIGIILSMLIIKEKIGLGSIASKFCTISDKTDCQAVLTSTKSSFFNLFDLSDLSINYFVCTTFLFILHSNSIFFGILSFLSLPIILYSVYQQYYGINKWCPLCLGIASILLVQFLILLRINEPFTFAYTDIFSILAITSITIASWSFLKPFLFNYSKNKNIAIEHLAFRRNHHLFLPYYNVSRKIETKQGLFPDIVLGCDDPLISIIAVTNPLCETCFEVHKTYKRLLDKYPKKVQITFRFYVPYTNRKDPRTQISERLLELYVEDDRQRFEQALEEWYSKVAIKTWLDKWKICEQIQYNHILGEQKKWCFEQNINSTPSAFINGKHFPRFYNPIDIENFMDSIIEFEENKIERQKNIYA